MKKKQEYHPYIFTDKIVYLTLEGTPKNIRSFFIVGLMSHNIFKGKKSVYRFSMMRQRK